MATLLSNDWEPGCFSNCGDGDGSSSSTCSTQGRRRNAESPPLENAALAREMNALSVDERERILEEIHGVADENKESPEFIASCLEKMDRYLSGRTHAKRRDLDRALFIKPSLRNDKKFKIMFLRADDYNAKKAVERMARYFSFKKDLFGEDKLVKRISLDDLDEQDLEVAQADSSTLLLPNPDRVGRPILVADLTRSTFQENINLNRHRFHVFMSFQDNEVAQKKGLVMIILSAGGSAVASRTPPTASKALGFFKDAARVSSSVPFRISSLHYCYDNPVTKFFVGLLQVGMARDVRLRLRSHFGSPSEIRYSLCSFGVITDGVIVSQGEEDKKRKLRQEYMEKRREIETREHAAISAVESTTGVIAYATRNDVLLGRGRSYHNFSGNQMFTKLLDANLERYWACDHLFEKRRIVAELIQRIHDSGGQFLKGVKDGWEIVDEEVAQEKIRKYFRSKSGGELAAANDDGEGSSRQPKRLKVNPSLDNGNGEQIAPKVPSSAT